MSWILNFIQGMKQNRYMDLNFIRAVLYRARSIRVVKIPGIDVQACAGTHVLRTGDIGPIKINKTERVQDGVERIDFSAGYSCS